MVVINKSDLNKEKGADRLADWSVRWINQPNPVKLWFALTVCVSYFWQDTSCWRPSWSGSWSVASRPGSSWSHRWHTTLAGSVSTTFTARGATTAGWHTARANWQMCSLPESWHVDSKVRTNKKHVNKEAGCRWTDGAALRGSRARSEWTNNSLKHFCEYNRKQNTNSWYVKWGPVWCHFSTIFDDVMVWT